MTAKNAIHKIKNKWKIHIHAKSNSWQTKILLNYRTLQNQQQIQQK